MSTPASLMNINTLISQLKKGIARKNRYRVVFSLPNGVIGGPAFVNANSREGAITQIQQQMNPATNGTVNIMCNTMNLPQRSLLTYDMTQNSAPFGVPYSASYDPITFTFYADSTLNTKKYFEIWQSTVVNFSNNTMNYPSEYVSDIQIWTLDVAGNDQYGITLKEAWPVTIGSLDYGYADNDSTQIVSVTMRYKAWIPQSTDVYSLDYFAGLGS